jgi:glycosyltransferase involved in cell wall biosynthesis
MQKISIVTPTYNEEENIELLCKEISSELSKINYDYEHIVIDNNSSDRTIPILRNICKNDKNVKVIINNKNYGHINSPFYGLLQSSGDATILINSDFQDPINLIPKMIEKWQEGKKVILLQKKSSKENILMKNLRKIYYRVLARSSYNNLTLDTTGSGLYDKSIIENLRSLNDPIPYLRGIVSEIESDISVIPFDQPKRKFGKTKNNFFTLIDMAMVGFVKHSKLPLRLMIIFGAIVSFVSIFISIIFLFYKLLYWNSFNLGIAPIVIGFFFISAIQILLLGLLGEYISVTLTHVRSMPLVVERERINF